MSAEQMAYDLKRIGTAMCCDATADAILKRWTESQCQIGHLEGTLQGMRYSDRGIDQRAILLYDEYKRKFNIAGDKDRGKP